MLEEKRGLDRNQLIGFLLIGAILIGASFWSQSQLPKEPVATQTTPVEETALPASPKKQTVPILVSADTSWKPAIVVLENEDLLLEWTTAGAQLVKAELKKYKNWQGSPLRVVDNNHLLALQGVVPSSAWAFVSQKTSDSTIVLSATKEGQSLAWTFTLPSTGYDLRWSLVGQGLKGTEATLAWEQQGLRHEKSQSTEALATTIYAWETQEDDDVSLSDGSDDADETSQAAWVAFKQQYFSSILTRDGGWSKATFATTSPSEQDTLHTRFLEATLSLPVQAGALSTSGTWYIGPNKYHTLADYNQHFDVIIPFGWGIFGWIARFGVVPIFDFLDGFNLNYGLIIFLMALLIKLVLLPLTFSSYKSMAKMRVLKPEIDEINEKFKDQDSMKKQQAVMALYSKAGVNPLGGCIPQLLQFPILIAMFRFFPASIELRQESFLWARDLSSYDSIFTLPFEIPFYGDHVSLFTILMAVSTYFYTKLNNTMTPTSGSDMMRQQMLIIQYVMPFMLLFFFNNYSSGLSYYYFIANVITFGQQYSMRFFINEEAIHAKIQDNKAKGGKKGGFQERLQGVMEQQKEAGNRRVRRNAK